MALEPAKIQAVLFDIDGTLSDTDDQMIQQVDRALKPFHLFFRRGQRKVFARWLVMAAESPGNYLYYLADRLNLDRIFIRLLDWHNRNRHHRLKPFWLMPGVDAMLPTLAARMPLGIVSARDERSCMAFINQFKLSGFFNVIVTSQTVRHTKPYPDPMLYAAEKLKISPDNCLMVGDTSVDIHAAKMAGMQSVGVLCGFGSEKELRRAGADLILKSTADLLTVLD
jgi:phosphoglycolate phosphatase-like HAD superfamily hydrolase